MKGFKKTYLIFVLCFIIFSKTTTSASAYKAKNINSEVQKYKPVIEFYAKQRGLCEYVDVLMAIMMVESEGEGLDPMQSSESRGLEPGAIKDPRLSIECGVEHFWELLTYNEKNGLDFWTTIQSYNYGFGFNFFVEKNGKKYTFELAKEFAKKMSDGNTWRYHNEISAPCGSWMYTYGNMFYVPLVQKYLEL